ncbi:hypothetical protein VYE96_00185 [Fusobacterium pseudoperiodonticum]|nr:hypothetical protein [Fusobacterium pseudoperiodonticum]
MIFFNLNMDNYMGELSDIENIKTYFFEDVLKKYDFSKYFYCDISPDNPCFFNHFSVINKEKNCFLLDGIDYEISKFPKEYIIKTFLKCNSITIKKFNKSLEELGLYYEFFIEISNKDCNNSYRDYMAENNFQIAYESIGNSNMSLEEKIDFICSELKKIKAENQILTIMDPYILPKRYDHDYLELFLGFIKKSKIKKLKLITSSESKKYNSDFHLVLKNELKKLSIALEVLRLEKLHDRRWIVEEKRLVFYVDLL